jgi:hypothetical protein
MSRSGRKSQEMRQVSFRMPLEVYQDYAAVAEFRGVDLSALLNWLLVEYRPQLLMRHAENGASLLRAAAMVGLPRNAAAGPDPQESLKTLTATIHMLQSVAARLSAHGDGNEAKPAA